MNNLFISSRSTWSRVIFFHLPFINVEDQQLGKYPIHTNYCTVCYIYLYVLFRTISVGLNLSLTDKSGLKLSLTNGRKAVNEFDGQFVLLVCFFIMLYKMVLVSS